MWLSAWRQYSSFHLEHNAPLLTVSYESPTYLLHLSQWLFIVYHFAPAHLASHRNLPSSHLSPDRQLYCAFSWDVRYPFCLFGKTVSSFGMVHSSCFDRLPRKAFLAFVCYFYPKSSHNSLVLFLIHSKLIELVIFIHWRNIHWAPTMWCVIPSGEYNTHCSYIRVSISSIWPCLANHCILLLIVSGI